MSQLSGTRPATLYPGVHFVKPLVERVQLFDTRDRVVATLVARHGRDRLGPVAAGLVSLEGPASLAVEALEVALGTSEAARVMPVLDARPSAGERLARLRAATGAPAPESDPDLILRDMVEDRADVWRSTWLRTCAIRAANARGVASTCDVVPALALGDAAIDEELDLLT